MTDRKETSPPSCNRAPATTLICPYVNWAASEIVRLSAALREIHKLADTASLGDRGRAQIRTAARIARMKTSRAIDDLILAAERVSRKYGVTPTGEPSDWTEWVNLRDAIVAAEGTSPKRCVGSWLLGNACGQCDKCAIEARLHIGDIIRERDRLRAILDGTRRMELGDIMEIAA